MLGEERPDTLSAMGNLAATLRVQGDYAESRRLGERALESRTRVLGEEHPDTLTSMRSVAILLEQAGDIDGALRLIRRCVFGRRKVLGDDHRETVIAVDLLRRLETRPQTAPPSEHRPS